MPPHLHHHIQPHLYPRITTHQFCVCPYFTYNQMYAPYEVPHYPHIQSLGYLHTPYDLFQPKIPPLLQFSGM